MNVKATNKVETNRYELELEVSPEEFNEAINTVYKRESKKMNIPGFRKGHAPRAFRNNYDEEEVFYEAAIVPPVPPHGDGGCGEVRPAGHQHRRIQD